MFSGWSLPPPYSYWIENMFKKTGSIAALFTVLALAACGSSDDDNGGNNTPSFTELSARNELMSKRVAAMRETSALPTTGRATYEGSGAFDVGANGATDMLADLKLEADFAASEVGGEFSNFVGRNGDEIGGKVTIADSVVNESTFDAVASGTLNDGEARNVDMTMTGTFRGQDARAVAGTMNGKIGSEDLGGSFVAAKK